MNGRRTSPVVPLRDVPPVFTSERRPAVLVVDDESAIADTVTEILRRSGYVATAAYDGNDALESALLSPPKLLISDVVLPGMSGIELAITIKRVFPDCKILLFSGQAATEDLMANARFAGHRFTLLSKPVHPRDLLARVAAMLTPQDARLTAIAS
jgi:DNA-binding response OmpR family regulator